MEKLLKNLFLIATVFLFAGAFASCSSDGDDESGGGNPPVETKTGKIETLYIVSKTALDIANLTIEYIAPNGALTKETVTWDKCVDIDKSIYSEMSKFVLPTLDSQENKVYRKEFNCSSLPDTCVAKVNWTLKEGVELADTYKLMIGMCYVLKSKDNERASGSVSALSFKKEKVADFFNLRSKDVTIINDL